MSPFSSSDPKSSALLEVGCEELPAALLPGVVESLRLQAEEAASAAGITFERIRTAGTPLRLLLRFDGLAPETLPRETVVTGPPLSAAGTWPSDPSPAARGFARTHGTAVENLEIVELPKGRYLAVRKKEEPRPVFDLLPGLFLRVLSGLVFPKSMRWGSGTGPFLRPVLWILALYRDEVVGFEFAGQVSGRLTFSPRFLGMEPVLLRNVAQYDRETRTWGVEVDLEERRERIANDLLLTLKLETSAGNWPEGAAFVPDPDLLSEVTCLVEGYRIVPAILPEKYRTLPPAVVRTVLKVHQRFFVVEAPGRKTVDHFLGVSGNPGGNLEVARDGYVRVVTARLEDAAYYIARDRSRTLADRVPDLDAVAFFPGVGSLGDKARATRRMVLEILGLLPDGLLTRHGFSREELATILERAATLYKADLLTGLVKEFPELEGEVGGIYAQWEQESSGSPDPTGQAVARAIASHYQPRTFRDPCPEDLPSVLLSLADRAVGQAGAFLGGASPSGSLDPFALRRSGQGMLRLLVEFALPLRLSALAEFAVVSWNLPDARNVRDPLTAFWEDRLQSVLANEGEPLWGRAARLGDEPPFVSARRTEFLRDFFVSPDFAVFETVKTRIERILPEGSFGPVEPGLLGVEGEKSLWEAFGALEHLPFPEYPERADFEGEVRRLRPLLPRIDAFFEAVLVNDPDPALRKNRLALLSLVSQRLAVLGRLDLLLSAARKERSEG